MVWRSTLMETKMAIPRSKARMKRATSHPGRVLYYEYMEPLNLTAGALAKAMGLSGRQRIERLVREEQAVTADTALRLARVFPNTSPEFWLSLQSSHDLTRTQLELGAQLKKIEPIAADA